MTLAQILAMAGYLFNLIGIIVCLVGLHLARRPSHRVLGRLLAVLGFLIAASPLLLQLFGFVDPATPVSPPPPR
ncbi:hypothetical protein [Modicisalibacter luteus]|jgi:ascorbate-specific PTS system EIIC-type component UlaA|uniref:DUF2788 domain-containing protein n=1 Tax=Modicisalibacter luteus TaxID=453962 RepID=A0ABV7LXN1_9GAMM|nr:hypothetical protein [Halomonas lutea]GHB05163.1 hypothetical protein GCM10007159_28740 [Halomonas lutea]